MAQLNIANNTTIPSTPSAGTVTLFPLSFNKQLYVIDELGTVSRVENKVASTVAAVTVTANATTLVVGGNHATLASKAAIPANSISVGATYRVTITGSFTGTATATAFQLRLGTLGTTADPIIFTASTTGAVGTSLARIVIEITFRTIGAAGTIHGYLEVSQHAAAVVGVSNAAGGYALVVGTFSTAPNTTVDNYLTCSILTAASGSSGTIQNAIIERL